LRRVITPDNSKITQELMEKN